MQINILTRQVDSELAPMNEASNFPSICDYEIPERCQIFAKLENTILNINADNIAESVDIIKDFINHSENEVFQNRCAYIAKLISVIPKNIRNYAYDAYAAAIKSTNRYNDIEFQTIEEINELKSRIPLNDKSFQYSLMFYKRKKDNSNPEFQEVIKNDDIEKFVEKYADEKYINATHVELSIEYSAVKIIKYLILTNKEDFKMHAINANAIEVGNIEVIKLLQSLEINYSNCLDRALYYHHNEVADWLLSNYEQTVKLYIYSMLYNIRGLLWAIETNMLIYDDNYLFSKLISIDLIEPFKYFMDTLDIHDDTIRFLIEKCAMEHKLPYLAYLIKYIKSSNAENSEDMLKLCKVAIQVYDISLESLIKYGISIEDLSEHEK